MRALRAFPLLLAAACAPASPAPAPARPQPPAPPPAAPAPPAAPPSAPAAAPAAPARTAAAEAACRAIEEASQRALDRALAASEELRGDTVPDLSRVLRGCLPSTPWAVEVEAAESAPCAGGCVDLRWRVVHVSPDGQVARGPSQQGRAGLRSMRPGVVAAADVDADGSPELLLGRRRAVIVCGKEADVSDEPAELWSFRAGQVAPYGPARAVAAAGLVPRELRDVDGDGRLDLLAEARAVAPLPCGALGGAALLEGPLLLAHARPDGTFALDDAAARAHALRTCPRPPSAIVLGSPKPALVIGAAARNVVCARLWGQPPEAIRKELDEARAQLCPGDPGVCPALEELRRWAAAPPPLSLGP